MTKYEPLELTLRAIPRDRSEFTITFHELESILGSPLPRSAYDHRPWWGNQTESKSRPQAHSWISPGFLVDAVHQNKTGGWVRFRRA
jgi:putative restriction endonuclease